MIINDSIFLLDETITNISKIYAHQQRVISGDFARLPRNQQTEAETEFEQQERMVKIYTLLSKETVRMLVILTRDFPKLFARDELTERVATYVNYFILQLAGSKSQQFKVQNTEKYNFDPIWLLRKIVRVFINMSKDKNFLNKVSADDRSYSNDSLQKAIKILKDKHELKYDDVAERFVKIIHELETIVTENTDIADLIGTPPDEFLDPIMNTLMRDPVILPTSNTVVDRTTISRILLTDLKDPFNRKPLTIDQIITDTETKQKIDTWIQSKLQGRK